MWSVAQVLSLVTFVVCTCHPAVGHCVSVTLREQPKTKCLVTGWVGYTTDRKWNSHFCQHSNCLLYQMKIFKKYRLIFYLSPDKVTAVCTLVSGKQSGLNIHKRSVFVESLKQPSILQSFLLWDRSSFSLTNTSLRTNFLVWYIYCCSCFKANLSVFFKMCVVLSHRVRVEPRTLG